MNPNFDLSYIKNILDLVSPVARETAPDALDKCLALYKTKATDNQPRIMIYGMYSHGKSTLVNALLGREDAPIGAGPTTAGSTPYTWEGGGCILLDTPGIQAKDEHTAIADDALRESELIAFVAESSSIESNLVWNELVRLVERGQKVCLVINDFDGCMGDPVKRIRAEDAFRKHLQDTAQHCGIYVDNLVSRVPLIFVDAKAALKAKLNGKQGVLQRSGLPDLEKEFVRLAASLLLTDTVNILRQNLLELAAQCRVAIAARSGDSLLSAAEEHLAAIKVAQENARLNIEQKMEDRIASYGSHISSLYASSSGENALRQGIENIAQQLSDEMTGVISDEITRAARRIEELCHEFDAITLRLAPHVSSGLQDNALLGADGNLNGWTGVLNLAGNYEESVKNGVLTVLKTLKSWLPSLFAGKGAATLGTWAATAGRLFSGVLAVAGVLLQLYDGYAAEQAAVREAERKAQAVADAVRQTQQALREAFMRQLEDALYSIFGKTINKLSENVASLRKEKNVDREYNNTLDKVEAALKASSEFQTA